MQQLGAFSFLLVALAASMAGAEPALHEEIDRLVSARASGNAVAPMTDDAAFLRRVSLDLAGVIPTAEAVRSFLADPNPAKRSQKIDELLAAPTYARRMEDLLHVMLMERRGDHEEWRKFLRHAAESNKPWDALARDILDPRSDDEATRGAAFFFSKRLEAYGQNAVDHPGLTRDVGRLFLGLDLQCAQCHDHLYIDDYKQADFQGLLFGYQAMAVRGDVPFPAVAETPKREKLEFISVFAAEKQLTGPRAPGGAEFEIPAGEAEFRPTRLLAADITRADNRLFSRNIANRLWWAMLGRGLVHPLDLHHADNPPSHPELLELLANELVAHQFDMRWLLREIALSQTYQRGSRTSGDNPLPPPELFLVGEPRRLSAEQLLMSTMQATGDLDRLLAEGAKPDDPNPLGLTALRKSFDATFANPPREPEVEYAATVKGALYLLNADQVVQLLSPRPGTLVERVAGISDSRAAVEELYLSVLSRLPDEEESLEAVAFLEARGERRTEAVGQLAWALLASTEFGLNH